jgi:hypothetical protein
MFRAPFLPIIGISYPYIGIGKFYAVLMTVATSCDDRLLPGAGWNYSSILLLVANGHHNGIKCTNAHVRLRTPDDGQKGCPKHVEL